MANWRIIAVLLAASFCYGAAILRSPKDAASQPKKRVVPKKTLSIKAPAVIIKRDYPFHITLMCDPATGIAGYAWYRRTNPLPFFGSMIFTTNNWVTESNLWHGTNYEFSVTTVGTNGVESDFSPIVRWPQPVTNYLALGLGATVSGPWTTNFIRTNPPTGFYRIHLQASTYSLHETPNFKTWTTVTNWPASNELPTFYLRASKWDQVSGKEVRD